MSSGLATPAQIRYIIQWFQEWSEMQRNDFLPILIQKYSNQKSVNGLISSLDSCNIEARPPSIFQCRIKLFKDWFETWNETEKEQFIDQIKSIDSDFMQKFNEQVNYTIGLKSNEVNVINGTS